MVQEGSDDQLTGLAEHLGYELHTDRPAVEPPFWRRDYFRLFISHITEHKAYAGALQAELLRHGVCGFVAHKDIQPTKEWIDEILLALRTADALVAILHQDFHKSLWTDQEIGVAMGRSIPVVSISLGEPPYGFMERYQAVNGMNKSDSDLAKELANIFRTHKQTRKRMAIAAVNRFENSETFEEAKANMGALERLDYWDSRLAERIRNAVKENGQIGAAWGLPERVESLLSKWV